MWLLNLKIEGMKKCFKLALVLGWLQGSSSFVNVCGKIYILFFTHKPECKHIPFRFKSHQLQHDFNSVSMSPLESRWTIKHDIHKSEPALWFINNSHITLSFTVRSVPACDICFQKSVSQINQKRSLIWLRTLWFGEVSLKLPPTYWLTGVPLKPLSNKHDSWMTEKLFLCHQNSLTATVSLVMYLRNGETFFGNILPYLGFENWSWTAVSFQKSSIQLYLHCAKL